MENLNENINNDNFGFSVISKEEFDAHADALHGISLKSSDRQLGENTIHLSETDKFKQYLNSIINKIPEDIHEELWKHLIDVIRSQKFKQH